MEKINRILIDCSKTYFNGLNTGIERVVRNIVLRSEIISHKLNTKVSPVILESINGYKTIEPLLNKKKENNDFKNNLKSFLTDRLYLNKKGIIYNFFKTTWSFIKRFQFFFTGLWQISNSFIYKIFALGYGTVLPEKNDLLIVIDSFMDYRYNIYFNFFCKKLRKNGGMVVVLLYDIIPLTNPDFFEKSLVSGFKEKIKKFNGLVDAILTISRSEAEIIRKENIFNIKSRQIAFFYPGYDFQNEAFSCEKRESNDNPEENNVRKELSDIISLIKRAYDAELTNRIYLMVGTIEARKGYDYVVDVFEELWKKRFGGILFVAGKIGWNVNSLMEKFKNSGQFNKKLFVFNNLNDREIDFLYKEASAVICASLREGFGLPLVEAMRYEIPVFASDIAVFREIGGDFPIYFEPCKTGLAEALKTEKSRFSKKIGNGENKASARNISWNESINMFSDEINKLIGNNIGLRN